MHEHRLNSPAKLGAVEKNMTEESILLACKICLKMLKTKSHLLAVLARIFDAKVPYYAGTSLTTCNTLFLR